MNLNDDTDILARTIYGEARGDYTKPEGGLSSLIAVANVIMNRLKHKQRFGRTLREVCLKPYQFSCWNKEDPNRPVIEKVSEESNLFALCVEVAEQTTQGRWPDLTKGSDHYHTLSVAPYWAKGKKYKVKIGSHLFYRLETE